MALRGKLAANFLTSNQPGHDYAANHCDRIPHPANPA